MTKLLAACALCFSLFACGDTTCEPQQSDTDLLREYAHKPLPTVYAAHLQCMSKFTVPRWTLSGRLADFGPAASEYALSHLDDRSSASFLAAQTTIDAHEGLRWRSALSLPQISKTHSGRSVGGWARPAMKELPNGKEVDKAMSAYTDFISEDEFKPFMDSLPKRSK